MLTFNLTLSMILTILYMTYQALTQRIHKKMALNISLLELSLKMYKE